MLVKNEPYVIEYNVRMGDPETQVVLPMMNSSLSDLVDSSINHKLKTFEYINRSGSCVTVVLAADGYPGIYKKGYKIEGLNKLNENLVFHAGTSLDNETNFITSGGRILNVLGFGKNLNEAIKDVYENVEKVNFKNKYFRKDIAKKGLNY